MVSNYIIKSIKTSFIVTFVIMISSIIEYYLKIKLKDVHPVHIILIKSIINLFLVFIISMTVLLSIKYIFEIKL